ncbi:NupC/NupG family nucleoside CNT transporter [Asticcacaulis sp. YBE204]|uniref:NupC/NupG family nucleoside CNT transporter n=1 Tax=Asticcacaulis sp. YBE204 TaxID=1282363 RepID=UPI0003C3B320|nr:nucleoside transporter C-terminal domain-containing protein [Asticcacaulis sp. YBE204]ESQ80635.1 nucleoside transporter [Asticcacaulis sp. YBE204]
MAASASATVIPALSSVPMMNTNWAIGIGGIVALLAIALLLSTDRKSIRLRMVACAFALQVLIGVLVLHTSWGKAGVQGMAHGVEALMSYSKGAIDMLFGGLTNVPGGAGFAINVLPVIVFFAALASVLYYLKIMQLIIKVIGGGLGFIIGISRVEALAAAANVLVGQSESPLVVRPYLAGLTKAQLFAIMASGMAGVAGTILAAYAQIGIKIDYLLAASFMSAPGGLLMAKLIIPDPKGVPVHSPVPIMEDADHHPKSLLGAISDGVQDGLKIAVSVGGMILAFVALIALLNGIIGGIAGLFGYPDLTLQGMLGFVLAPIMFLINIPWNEAVTAGGLFGEKLIMNEFVAYIHLMNEGGQLSPRSTAIMSFALCGFANLSSIAIQLAVIGGLAPNQRDMIVKIGPRALAAATLANLMNAAIAGLLIG